MIVHNGDLVAVFLSVPSACQWQANLQPLFFGLLGLMGVGSFFVVLLLFFFFVLQMGGASSYNTQFMPHPGPRGPPGMASSTMVGSRPPTMGGMYGSQGQRMPQHSGYPGGQQGPPPRHQQGLKRPYNSEVSERRSCLCFLPLLAVGCNLIALRKN